MVYKKAFKCSRCPENNTEKGCPVWWEMVLKNEETGQTKVTKACGFTLLPQLMAMVSTDTLHSVAASYDMRNKVVENVGKVIGAINDKLELNFEDEELKKMSSFNSKLLEENKGE
jgi:hypothetical protein